MTADLNMDELRRRAPLHYWAKADNARFAAYVLWNLIDNGKAPDGAAIDYHGTPKIALNEAWVRERSISLECIIKAAFAQRDEDNADAKPVPSTHNVGQLWTMPGLPNLEKEDQLRLAKTWQLLQWAGRYAAPRKGSDDQRNLIDASQFGLNGGKQLRIIRPLKFGWEEFDAHYQTAAVKFMERRRSMHPEIPSP